MLRILDLVEVKKVFAIILTNLVLEGDVDCDLKEISEHTRNKLIEVCVGGLNAGVSVDFDEPDLVVCVDDEVEAEELETVVFHDAEFVGDGEERDLDELLHPVEQRSLDPALLAFVVEVLLQRSE